MKTRPFNRVRNVLVGTFFLLAIQSATYAQQAETKTPPSQQGSNQQVQPGQSSRLQAILAKIAAKRNGTVPTQQKLSLLTAANKPIPKPISAPPKNIPQTYYKFTGNGSWFKASNWENQHLPPQVLKAGDHIIIDTKGFCLFNNKNAFFLVNESSLELKPGSTLYVSLGNNFILRGGAFSNNGTIKIISGHFRLNDSNAIAGNIQTTRLSRLDNPKTVLSQSPSATEMPDLKKK